MHPYKIELTDIQYKKMSFIVFRDRKNMASVIREALNAYLDQADINEYVDTYIEDQYKRILNEDLEEEFDERPIKPRCDNW